MYVCVCVCVCVCIYICTHTHTHTLGSVFSRILINSSVIREQRKALSWATAFIRNKQLFILVLSFCVDLFQY